MSDVGSESGFESDGAAAPVETPSTHPWRTADSWHPASVASLSACLTLLAFWPLEGRTIATAPATIAWPLILVVLGAAVAASSGSAAARRWSRWTLAAWFPVAVSLFVVHGLVYPEGQDVLWRRGPLAVTVEGLSFAAVHAARWLAVAASVAVLGATCTPAALARAVETAPLPGGLGHALAAALLLAPTARRTAAQIREAQRARGLTVNGSPVRRVRSLAPLVVPLAVGLIVDGQERALALTARGYTTGGRMSQFAPLSDSVTQRRIRRIGLAVVILALAAAHIRHAAP